MFRAMICLAAAAALAACANGGRLRANDDRGIDAGRDAQFTAIPEVSAICDVDSLSSQRSYYNSYVQDLRSASTDLRIDESSGLFDQRRLLIRRMNAFDTEIDGKYRAVTSSCKAFSRCMQNNFYDEGECRSTLSRWERADADYSDLARELREIEAETDRLLAALRRPNVVGGGPRRFRPWLNRCECSQSVGGVFANCCDPDPAYERRRYERY